MLPKKVKFSVDESKLIEHIKNVFKRQDKSIQALTRRKQLS